jgi:DNA-directed RNA polymerase specialized sigma subunit
MQYMDNLTETNRQIMRMKYFEDKTTEQISLAIELGFTQIKSLRGDIHALLSYGAKLFV